MKINLTEISEVLTTFEFKDEPHTFPVLRELTGKGDCQFVSPVHTELSTLRIRDWIEVTGKVKTDVQMKCSRCLTEFSQTISSEFELTYSDQKEDNSFQEEEDIELSRDELDRVYYSGDHIDFRDQVQEQIVMALPLLALCKESCKGLCQECGIDLNKEKCNCNKVIGHPAFAALRNLKK